MAQSSSHNTKLIPSDPDYPLLLKETPDPPKELFVEGDITLLKSPLTVAVVGTRKATAYGLSVTEKLSEQLAKRGLIIISGLARGIDAAAHKGALNVGGKTIAVLGLGLDKIYPPEHRGLAQKIVSSGGLLISEYPPGKPGLKFQFAMRNRIIAGLAQAVVIAEAPEKSGALITASVALDYNREVFAIPGNITNPAAAGTNTLIAQGARVVLSSQDVFEAFPDLPDASTNPISEISDDLTPETLTIVNLISINGPLTLDEIITKSGLSVSTISQNLSRLELSEKVVSHFDGTYAVK